MFFLVQGTDEFDPHSACLCLVYSDEPIF
jgi:hypothetical protein